MKQKVELDSKDWYNLLLLIDREWQLNDDDEHYQKWLIGVEREIESQTDVD